MNKYVLAGLLALFAGAAETAQAQVFLSRPSRPSPADPRTGYLYGAPRGAYGYQQPFTPGLYPGGVGAPGGVGNPALQQQQQQAGTFLSQGRQAGAGLADLGSPNITGHPTRFASYAGYFSNQGGSTATPAATAPYRTPATNTAPGGVGTMPTTTPPAKTKAGGGGASRTPAR